jgi:hypothetical protein
LYHPRATASVPPNAQMEPAAPNQRAIIAADDGIGQVPVTL